MVNVLGKNRVQSSGLGARTLVSLAIVSINAGLIASVHADEIVELDTIVVTGEKIERTQQETTAAVTVLTEDDIEKMKVTKAIDLADQIPNVTVGGFGGILNIRGVDGNGGGKSSFSWVGATRARVSTTTDGVASVWTGGNLLDSGMWDAQQVEVLRGPQSTAQGRSSIGGAMVIKTNDPTFESEGKVRVGVENANSKNKYQTAAVSSGALTDDLAYRLSGEFITGEHYINYVDNSSTADYNTDPDDIESQDIKAKLLWQPESMPELTARFDLVHKAQEGPYINSVNPTGETYTATLADDSNGEQVGHRISDSAMNAIVANIEYEFSDEVLGTFVGSVSDFDNKYYHNADDYPFKGNWEQRNISLEGRLEIDRDDSDFKTMIGASVISDEADIHNFDVNQDGSYSSDYYKGTTETVTTSIFGESSYQMTEKLQLSFGGRIENEAQTRDATFFSTEGLSDSDINNTYLLPKVGASYVVSDNTTVGIDFRQGYTPGGQAFERQEDQNESYEYDEEYVNSIEFSSRSRVWNNRASINFNAFYNEYKDYQAYSASGRTFTKADNSTYEGRAITNVDEAKTQGAEIEVRVLVTENIELFATASVLDTEVVKFEKDTSLEGGELPFSADNTYSLGFNHQLTDSFNYGANFKHVAEYYDDLDNDASGDDSDVVGDYTVLNVDVEYVVGDLTFRGYVNNVTDEYVTTYDDSYAQSVKAPRTVGMNMDYAF